MSEEKKLIGKSAKHRFTWKMAVKTSVRVRAHVRMCASSKTQRIKNQASWQCAVQR